MYYNYHNEFQFTAQQKNRHPDEKQMRSTNRNFMEERL